MRDPRWLLAALPALAAAWGLLAWAATRRRAVAAALGRETTLARVAEDAAANRRLAAVLRLSALALIFTALAGPQWGVDLVATRGAARQAVVALDVSLSMQTPDVKPSRLERAKGSLSLLLDQMQGDRVGVVAFAGDAQVVCPLTTDVAAAKELLGALDVGAVPVPGTAIGTAIRAAAAMLSRYEGPKTVVLLTDGEDHHSDPLGAAREAASAGVRVFTVGIGTSEGEPIPVEGGGYKKDAKGVTVISRLGEQTLAQVASLTGGAYYRTSPSEDEISDIVARVKAGDPTQGLAGTSARWHDRYLWPLSLAFLLLMLELALPLRALAAPAALGSASARKAAAAVLLLALLAPSARAALFEGALRDANGKYEEGKYEDALDLYSEASGRAPSDPRPVFNAGDALYKLDRDSDAAGAFDSVAARRDAPQELRAAALYNLGNARYSAGDYAAAADAYRRSLAAAPEDPDARRNLVLALLRQKNPPPKKPQDKNSGQQQKKDQPSPQDQKQGAGRPPPPQPRPQDALSREDAERVMRAVSEREKAAQRQSPQPQSAGRRRPPPPSGGEDW